MTVSRKLIRQGVFVAAVCSTILQTGCSFVLGTREDKVLYALAPEICSLPEPSHKQSVSLLVRPLRAEALAEGKSIIFSKTKDTRGTYRLAYWAESPARQLSRLLVRQLACSVPVKQVVSGLEPTAYDYVIAGELSEFLHDVSTTPGNVRVRATFELYNAMPKKLIERREFLEEQAATTFDAGGASAAFTIASSKLLRDVANWVAESLPSDSTK